MLQKDSHLVALLCKEDAPDACLRAFGTLYDKYHAILYRAAIRLVKSEELAKEIVQDAFVKLWENRRQLDPTLSVAAYLYTITRNCTLNVLKKAARENKIKDEIIAGTVWTGNTVEWDIGQRECQSAIDAAIDALPPQRKRIFLMCREEGKSYEEVARIFGISRSTVHDHMVKALKALREYFYLKTDFTISIACMMLYWADWL